MKANQARYSAQAQKLADEYFDIGLSIQLLNSRLNEIKQDLSSLKDQGFIDEKIETDDFTLSFQAGKTTHIFPQDIVDAIDEAKSLGLTQKKQGPGFWKLYSKKPKP